MREVDISTAFVGSVDAYTATSDNEAAVSVSWAGSAVSLTAEGAGAAFVEVRAFNEGGSVSQWIGAVSTAAAEEDEGAVDDDENEAAPPDNGSARNGDEMAVEAGGVSSPLAITLVAQAYCLPTDVNMMSEEESAIFWIEPSAVARFGVTYAVIGGQPPYSVTSPEAAETASGPSGVLQVACAVPDPATDGGNRLYLADAGALAIAVEVSDATGETASATVHACSKPCAAIRTTRPGGHRLLRRSRAWMGGTGGLDHGCRSRSHDWGRSRDQPGHPGNPRHLPQR